MPATEPLTLENGQSLREGKENASADAHSTTELHAAKPDLMIKMEMETNVVSMTSGDSKLVLSSPAEASPAKPTMESSCALNGSSERSPTTSCITSASESLVGAGPDFVKKMEPTPFGCAQRNEDPPATLSFQGVSVTLENNSLWKQFHKYGTEMILTKHGRRMFPYCRYRLSGLDPTQQYSLVLSIVPSDNLKYRFNAPRWEVSGLAEHRNNSLIRAFCHNNSPRQGSAWMAGAVSFFKLKLTNNPSDEDGHIILNSFHRYIPRLHVIPIPEGIHPTPDQPILIGPNCLTFTFPQTEFMGVTTYQNFSITKLKIDHNPFAKSFREDGNRLNKSAPEPDLVEPPNGQDGGKANKLTNNREETLDSRRLKVDVDPVTSPSHTRLVLKPIMSTKSSANELYVPCVRGSHALGELVLVEESDKGGVEKNEAQPISIAGGTPIVMSTPMASSTPEAFLAGSSARYCKKRSRVDKRWGNSGGKEWKNSSISAEEAHGPLLNLGTQPELDDVDGLVFASFDSKEALEVQDRDKHAMCSSPASPVSTVTDIKTEETMEVDPETDEEKLVRFQACLLQDLPDLKYRQVIHPVLQGVGLKLSLVGPTQSIDLQYLGVPLPLPAPVQQEHQASMTHKSFPFISRTGKTSDMTKLKGWKNKLVRSTEASSSSNDGSAKNLSAFCSNMLDEYLESEGQMICERAAAFSTHPEDPVVYQLPAKSSSYVRTLDSVLKQRNSKGQVAASKPCPLSYKVPQLCPTRQEKVNAAQSSATNRPVKTGLVLQGSPTQQQGSSQNQSINSKQSSIKFMYKMTPMEKGAINKGLNRVQLTAERLEVALSVMLTKEMQANSVPKVIAFPTGRTQGPECGGEFCKLGCICYSLKVPVKVPLHCRRPECMFGCTCFKRKIRKKLSPGEPDPQMQPVYSVTTMEHTVQPQPGSHVNKLWKRTVVDRDPEPLYSPVNTTARSSTPVFLLRNSEIPEEDKDPVYKYFESMMTCARVREFNAKPPQVSILPEIFNTLTSTVKEKKTAEDGPKKYFRTLNNHIKEGNTDEGTESKEAKVRQQIEIQSVCEWDLDRKKVIETLCRRMSQGKLTQLFKIGPYLIRPLAKISVEKPSGSIITYRVCISKPSKGDEDGLDFEGEVEEDEENSETDRPAKKVLVTPFLSGVLPAGTLRCKPKQAGTKASGLVQVNGKSYNQARLLLGSMGSLNPSNRVAGYITGRLRVPTSISLKFSEKRGLSDKINSHDDLRIKVAGAVVPPTVSARKTTDLQVLTKTPVQTHQPNLQNSPTTPELQTSQTPLALDSGLTAVPEQSSSDRNSQGGSSPSFSLTVCPKLKTPSFVEQSGTYRFRICPPTKQSAGDQFQRGIVLPGGFTLIQLSKQGANKDAPRSENTENVISGNEALLQDGALCDRRVLPGFEGYTGSNLGDTTEGSTSQESNVDLNLEGSALFDMDEDVIDGFVDIETVEEEDPASSNALTRSPKSKSAFVSERCSLLELRRKNHTVVERLRRSEQKGLFDKLVNLLNVDPKTPRLHLLTMASNEIKELEKTASFLEEQKKTLKRLRTSYVKDLSQLTGKSEKMIKSKLLQLYNKQKANEKTMKWTPFFSSLLKSRAALLQPPDTGSCDKAPSLPLLEPNLSCAPSLPCKATGARVNFVLQTVKNEAPSQPAALSANSMATTSPSDLQENKLDKATAPAQFTIVKSKDSEEKGPTHIITNGSADIKPLVPLAPKPHQNLTLPLIRSKTGRIILPSSLKPIGQGYYTITFLSPKQKKEGGDDKLCGVDSAEKESATLSKTDLAPDDGCVEADKGSDPDHTEKLTDCNSLTGEPSSQEATSNSPSVAVEMENRPAKVSKKEQTAGAILRKGRGRPPKRRLVSVPGKRGRGRPRKTTTVPVNDGNPSDHSTTWRPGACSSADKSSKCTPTRSNRLPDRNSRRPLTRGALGKDFPSAKKRSWIDIERELEPDTNQ